MPCTVDILCDVGGTNMRVAAAAVGGGLRVPIKVPTPQDPQKGIATLIELAYAVAEDADMASMVIGFPGLLNENGELYDTTNLPRWRGIRLAQELALELHIPIRVENDACMAGLGEACFGAGRVYPIVGYVTVSTGVGGGRIVHGVIDHHPYIVGHQKIGGFELEELISGTAVRRRFGCDPQELHRAEVKTALADELAVGLYYAYKHWSPDALILGGPMMLGENPIPIDRVRKQFAKYVPRATPAVRLAELGDMSGLHGARIRAQQIQGSAWYSL